MSEQASNVPVASATGLAVRYGATTALVDVGFDLTRGEVLAVLGRNGAGKTSLVRCLLGQQRPSAGSTTLFGADAWRTRTAAMRRVGVVPETPDMPPGMTAEQLEAFCGGLYPEWNGAAVRERLARFGVPTTVPLRSLSRGQRAQLSLALALGHGPELLVLDDPTLGLDAVARRSVLEEIVDELAARGATVLVTTHDLAGIEGVADRIGILAQGRIVADEALDALKARFRRIVRPAGTQVAPPFRAIRERAGAWGSETVVSDFSPERFADWLAGGVRGASEETMSLEEIFIALVGTEGVAS